MCKAEPWNEGYISPVTWKELAWQLFFIRVITRVYTRTCAWFQLRLQFVLDLENKNPKKNKEKTNLNQIKTKKKVSSIQEKFRFFVLPVALDGEIFLNKNKNKNKTETQEGYTVG